MAPTLANADQKLRDAVIRQLEWDPQVDASPIRVSAQDGIVTLTGCVETLTARLEAERAVNEVAGVTGVVNDLEVRIY
jgi:osmotically-inducible protein OsmY